MSGSRPFLVTEALTKLTSIEQDCAAEWDLIMRQARKHADDGTPLSEINFRGDWLEQGGDLVSQSAKPESGINGSAQRIGDISLRAGLAS